MGCILSYRVPFCTGFCVPKYYHYAEGKTPANAHRVILVFVVAPLLWFWHSEVHLSEEKPAALVELVQASLGPVGDCLCSGVDVLYLRLNQDCLSLTTKPFFLGESSR